MRAGPFETVWFRVVVATAVGVATGFVAYALAHAAWAPVLGWVAAAATLCGWTWLRVRNMDAGATASHATVEDAGRAAADVLLLVASLAALVGVGLLLAANRDKDQAVADALVGVAGVAGAWFLVHTLFMLRYARLYYTGPDGGIDFGDDAPTYRDFAYVAFTLGMTYQVSDTTLTGREIRHTALRHAMLSFLLGAVVLAVTINLVVQLASQA